MILFKACPRCGGDVDTTYHEDAYCVQCSHRPTVVFPGPRIIEWRPFGAGASALASGRRPVGEAGYEVGYMQSKVICPKCGSEKGVRLEKLRPEDNTCYRCRSCGHIFSPSIEGAQATGEATLP